MESDRSDQSNVDRPKMETEGSTSSKLETNSDDCPISKLPSDVLAKIIVYIPVAQWLELELLDENFCAATRIAWRQLRYINVDQEFFNQQLENSNDKSSSGEIVEAVLQKLVEYSLFLTDIRFVAELINSDAIQSLAQFEHLQSITLGKAKTFDGRNGTPWEYVVDFLELTRSRASLKELRLYDVSNCGANLNRFASSFVNGREIQSPLMLEKFLFSSSETSLSIRLDTFDTTRLTDVRLGKAPIQPDQLTNLIVRASNLLRIEFSFLHCVLLPCNGRFLQAYKKLLTALASHERLMAITFGTYGFDDTECMNFGDEFIDMLKSIGHRGQLRKLAIDDHGEVSGAIGLREICLTIGDCMHSLQSIKILDFTNGDAFNAVSLPELEEIHFSNYVCSPLTGNAVQNIAQFPRLKRLALDAYADTDKKSLGCLATATTLADVRIRYGYWIHGDVFDKWSDGFNPNLPCLMLCRLEFCEDYDDDGEYDEEDGLVRMLEKAVQLRVLILDGRITDRSLMAIASSCPMLEIFGVRSTYNKITAPYLQEVVDRCPKLKKLGGIKGDIWKKLKFPDYRKIGDVDMVFCKHDFDDDEYD